MKAKISLVLRIVISVGLVAFLLWSMRSRFPEIKNTLLHTSLFIFSLAAICFVINIIFLSARLKLLFAGEGLNIPFGRVVQLSYIGYFFNNFMPTAVGGDIVKAYYAYKQTKKAARSFISVFMDRFIGLFSFVCIAFVVLFFSWGTTDLMLKKIIFIFAFGGMIGSLVILNSAIAKFILIGLSGFKLWNLGERLSKIYRAAHEYRNKKMLVLAAIGVSAMSQCIYFVLVYMLGKSLGIDIGLTRIFLIMPLVGVMSMLPSLGGLGIREGAMVLLFGPLIGNDNAFSVSILLLALLLLISLIGAIIYISASQFKLKQAEISALDDYRV